MPEVVATATRVPSGVSSGPGFVTDGDAFAAYLICIAIAVAVFELVRGATDRHRIKIRRKG